MDVARSVLASSPVQLDRLNITSISSLVMNSVTSFLLLGSLALQTVLGLPDPTKIVQEREAQVLKRSVDSFIATESPIALRDLLCNIGSTGACVPGASSGIVIASPDSTNPDCNSCLNRSNLHRYEANLNQTFTLGLAIPH